MDICLQTAGIIPYWGAKEGYRMIREAGFASLDWSFYIEWDRPMIRAKQLQHCIFDESVETILDYYKEELDAIEENGLRINQAHAPFPAYVKEFPEFNEYAIATCKKCIRVCDAARVKYLVVHGISHELGDYTQTPEMICQMNYRLYESLIPTLLETDVVVCLENLFTHSGKKIVEGVCSVPEEAIGYIDALNAKAGKECFALCLDTGHLNVLGKHQGDYIRALGSRIKALHLDDNNGVEDEHIAPYAGNIIWKDVIGALKDIGYDGDLNFEVHKQLEVGHVDPDMVPVWLKTIYETGVVFRKWLEE